MAIFTNPDVFFANQKQQALSDLKKHGLIVKYANPQLYYVDDETQLKDNIRGNVQDGDYVLVSKTGKKGYIYRSETGKYIGEINVGNK